MSSRYQSERYPVGAYSFSVTVGNKKIGFSRVSGIDFSENYSYSEQLQKVKKVNYISGESSDELDLSKKSNKEKKLVLEKAFLPYGDGKDSEQDFVTKYMKVNTQIEQITIEVMNASGNTVFTLVFQDCFVSGYSLSELDANRTGYITQTITIQYRVVSMK